jgi:hypothetical protein
VRRFGFDNPTRGCYSRRMGFRVLAAFVMLALGAAYDGTGLLAAQQGTGGEARGVIEETPALATASPRLEPRMGRRVEGQPRGNWVAPPLTLLLQAPLTGHPGPDGVLAVDSISLPVGQPSAGPRSARAPPRPSVR